MNWGTNMTNYQTENYIYHLIPVHAHVMNGQASVRVDSLRNETEMWINLNLPGCGKNTIRVTSKELHCECSKADEAIECINSNIGLQLSPDFSHNEIVIKRIQDFVVFIQCICWHIHKSEYKQYLKEQEEEYQQLATDALITEHQDIRVTYNFKGFKEEFPYIKEDDRYYMLFPNGSRISMYFKRQLRYSFPIQERNIIPDTKTMKCNVFKMLPGDGQYCQLELIYEKAEYDESKT